MNSAHYYDYFCKIFQKSLTLQNGHEALTL